MIADMVGRAGKLQAQGIVQPALEMGAPHLVPAHPDIRGKQVHMGVEVPHVQGQGVLRRQLPDLIQ